MAQGERDYVIASAIKTFRAEDWLVFEADPLEWRSIKDVAAGAGLSQNEAYRSLMTLKSAGRVEQSDRGWRISPEGVIRYSFRIQEVLTAHAQRLGVKKGII